MTPTDEQAEAMAVLMAELDEQDEAICTALASRYALRFGDIGPDWVAMMGHLREQRAHWLALYVNGNIDGDPPFAVG